MQSRLAQGKSIHTVKECKGEKHNADDKQMQKERLEPQASCNLSSNTMLSNLLSPKPKLLRNRSNHVSRTIQQYLKVR